MSGRRLAENQPASFEFTPESKARLEKIIAKYPEGRQASAVISALWQAQKQNDYWLPRAAIEKVADQLGMPYIRVLEVATFYTMFNWIFPAIPESDQGGTQAVKSIKNRRATHDYVII